VEWRVVALWKGGREERPTNLDCSVLFCNSIIQQSINHGYVDFEGISLLWHLSNAFSASALEASSILYLLNIFFSPKE